MIKSKFGPITNPKTGETKDIVVNALSKRSLRDILIGGGHYNGRYYLPYNIHI